MEASEYPEVTVGEGYAVATLDAWATGPAFARSARASTWRRSASTRS